MRSAREAGQRLRVGIGDDEVDPDQSRDDHVVDGVAAGAADAAHHDAGLQFPQLGRFQIDRHRLASRRWSAGQGRPGFDVCFIRRSRNGRHPSVFTCPPSLGSRQKLLFNQRPTRPIYPFASGPGALTRRERLEMFVAAHLRIDEQADRRGEGRAFRRFRQPCDAERRPDAHLPRNDPLRRLRHAGELARAAGEDEPPAAHGRESRRSSAGRARVPGFPRRAA